MSSSSGFLKAFAQNPSFFGFLSNPLSKSSIVEWISIKRS
jgi:hypothetical protein